MRPSDSLVPIGRGYGFPRRWPTSLRALVLCDRYVCSPTHRVSETGHRLSVAPELCEEERGPPRLPGRPLRACRGRTPRRIEACPRPTHGQALIAFEHFSTLGIRDGIVFEAAYPTAHALACLRFADGVAAIVARLATGSGGLTPGRTDFASAGRLGRAMARTGLRMMPTFPSPSLKFRTAGFPRYGFKASMSDGAFLQHGTVKLAPSMPAPRCSLRRRSPASATARWSGSASRLLLRASTGRCARGLASLPQGSLAPVRVVLSRSLIAYYDPIRQSRGHAATSRPCRLYAAPSLCGAPRRPARPSLLSLPCFPHVPSTLRRWVRCTLPLYWCRDARLPRVCTESPPTNSASASNARR